MFRSDLGHGAPDMPLGASPLHDGQWQCEQCTLINEGGAVECAACGAPRPANSGSMLPPGGSFGDLPSGLELVTDSPHGFLPPTAAIKSTEESPILPPHGTQNFGSRNLPPQGTLSPNAMADLMPTPASQQGYLGGTPQSLGYGDLSLGDDRDREAKKKKKKKKDPGGPGPSQDEDLSRTREAQAASPVRQRELLQLPQEKRRERVRPSEEQDDSSLPTYVPAATRAGAALTGSLEGSKVLLRILRAYNLRNTDLGILPEDASDPFAVARIGPKDFKTHVVENSQWAADSAILQLISALAGAVSFFAVLVMVLNSIISLSTVDFSSQ